jgi:glycosyltransferase involved in cell wall biosynthesis
LRKAEGKHSTGANMTGARLTLVVTTIRRPHAATRFLDSARHHCPTLKIILGEQAEKPELTGYCAASDIEHLSLSFDCGVSHARNSMIGRAGTEYVALADDDFLFSEALDFDFCMRFLEANPDFICVLGQVKDYKASGDKLEPDLRDRIKNICLDETGRGVVFVPVVFAQPKGIVFERETLVRCDFGPNWGVFRRSFFVGNDFWWDERFKIGGEHLDFYLRLKIQHPTARVAYWSKLMCDHIPIAEDSYLELRHRQTWRDAFRVKWKLRYRYDIGSSRLYDDWANPVAVSSPVTQRLKHQLDQCQETNRQLREQIAALQARVLESTSRISK